jgi:hypothetical protein
MDLNTAICLVHVECFADVAIWAKVEATKSQAYAALRKGGINPNNPAAVDEAYSDLVIGICKEELPEGWGETYDYWGGRCFSYNPGWNAPRSGTVMAGENHRFACCTCEQAIRDSIRTSLEVLEEA